LVTAESWSNLTVNESFANYSEYLWNEHKYGKDQADYHLMKDVGNYLHNPNDFLKI
jgi:aminopeptidase N